MRPNENGKINCFKFPTSFSTNTGLVQIYRNIQIHAQQSIDRRNPFALFYITSSVERSVRFPSWWWRITGLSCCDNTNHNLAKDITSPASVYVCRCCGVCEWYLNPATFFDITHSRKSFSNTYIFKPQRHNRTSSLSVEAFPLLVLRVTSTPELKSIFGLGLIYGFNFWPKLVPWSAYRKLSFYTVNGNLILYFHNHTFVSNSHLTTKSVI